MLRHLAANNLKLNDHQRRAKTPAKLTQSKTGQWADTHTHTHTQWNGRLSPGCDLRRNLTLPPRSYPQHRPTCPSLADSKALSDASQRILHPPGIRTLRVSCHLLGGAVAKLVLHAEEGTLIRCLREDIGNHEMRAHQLALHYQSEYHVLDEDRRELEMSRPARRSLLGDQDIRSTIVPKEQGRAHDRSPDPR